MYEHPEIKTFETYYKKENPHFKKALDDFKISGDTVKFHYYKHPDHNLDFIKVHKNTAQTDWEKHLIATSPMYSKRIIALTERQREKMDREQKTRTDVTGETIVDKVIKKAKNNVFISIFVIIGIIVVGLANFSDAIKKLAASFSVNQNRPEEKDKSENSSNHSTTDTTNSINVNRSNNVTINQNQNAKPVEVKNKQLLKDALGSLDLIESYIYVSIDSEPDQYSSLLSRARGEIRNISKIKGRTHDLILNTYDCYHDAGELWQKKCPTALLKSGVTSALTDATTQFRNDTYPNLSLKWRKCSEYLRKAHEYFEME